MSTAHNLTTPKRQISISQNSEKNINVKIGTVEDFKKLEKLDYTNTMNKIFQVDYENYQIEISEVDLEEPIVNDSHEYSQELAEEMLPKLNDKSYIPLVVYVDNEPAGYMLNQWQFWSKGKVMINHGILVANKYARQGLAKKLIEKSIQIAQEDDKCQGIHVEMCTFKYQANKLLLSMGFMFAGTKFFIWHNDLPYKNSKEALYFYYKIK
jgi:GNAT superfamily N-acetyltransferase